MMKYTVATWVALPNPDPSAPAAVQERVDIVLGFIKWGSLIAVIAGLMAFGGIVWASERSGHAGKSTELKEKFGTAIVALIVVMTATSIVSFITG